MAFAGLKFCPSDEEIVDYYLKRKLEGLPIPPMTIQEHDDYFLDPHTLDWGSVSYLIDHEKYYFMKRTSTLTSDRGKGKKAKRSGGDQSGFWKAAQVDKKIYDSQNQVCGLMTMLNFFLYSDQSTKIRKEAIRTRFIMHEYKLPTQNTFQEWVVCRVKNDARQPRRHVPALALDYPPLQPQLPAPPDQQPPPPDQPAAGEIIMIHPQHQVVPVQQLPPPDQPAADHEIIMIHPQRQVVPVPMQQLPPPDQPAADREIMMDPHQQQIAPPKPAEPVEVVAVQQDQQQLQPSNETNVVLAEDDFANAWNGLLASNQNLSAESHDYHMELQDVDKILSCGVTEDVSAFYEEQEVPQKQLKSTSEYEMIVKPPQPQPQVVADDDAAEQSPQPKRPRVCESSSDAGPVQPPEPQDQPVNEEPEPEAEAEAISECKFVQFMMERVTFD